MTMRPFVTPLLALASATVLSSAAPAQQPGVPRVSIANTEVRSLHSRTNGRDYDLYVYLPSRPDATPGHKYPVLYLLDGQWDFKLLTSIQGGLLYDKYVPDVIVVGITYSGAHANYDSLRAVDYTPRAGTNNPGSGQGAHFLAFMEQELFPFIEANYPVDPAHRALMGSSLGGLFTLYAMFARPDLFTGYVAASPAVSYANRGIFADEAAFAAKPKALHARLFVAVGDQEPLLAPVQEFVQQLKQRNYKGLTLESRVIAGERHSGNKPEAFNRGLRFLFQ